MVTMLIALVLLILIAYFEGRSIVRTLGRFGAAAHDIAHGRLDRRVPRSRDGTSSHASAAPSTRWRISSRPGGKNSTRSGVGSARRRCASARRSPPRTTSTRLLRMLVETAVDSTGARAAYSWPSRARSIRKWRPRRGRRAPRASFDRGRGELRDARSCRATSSPATTARRPLARRARRHRARERAASSNRSTPGARRRSDRPGEPATLQAALAKELLAPIASRSPLTLVVADSTTSRG